HRPPGGPRLEDHLDLDRGVATGVQDLAAGDVLDDAHGTEGSSSSGGLVQNAFTPRARGGACRADPDDAARCAPLTPVGPARFAPALPSPSSFWWRSDVGIRHQTSTRTGGVRAGRGGLPEPGARGG